MEWSSGMGASALAMDAGGYCCRGEGTQEKGKGATVGKAKGPRRRGMVLLLSRRRGLGEGAGGYCYQGEWA